MTVSAQLHVINRRNPSQSVNYACCGNTRCSVYLPMPITEKRSFVPLAGGAFYGATDQLYKTRHRNQKAALVLGDLEKALIRTDHHQSVADIAYQTILGTSRK